MSNKGYTTRPKNKRIKQTNNFYNFDSENLKKEARIEDFQENWGMRFSRLLLMINNTGLKHNRFCVVDLSSLF